MSIRYDYVNMKLNYQRGFSLIELLLIIAIVGILAGIVLTNVTKARERAQIAKVVLEVKEISKIIAKYYADTGTYPATCGDVCTVLTDPFVVDLGVAGWEGPYGALYNNTHSWGGHFGITDGYDLDGDGVNDSVVVLNDDRPGLGDSDNGGQIPRDVLLGIDKILDDGDLTTGNMRGDGSLPTALGEGMIKIST